MNTELAPLPSDFGDLVHALSQPLTTLRCALELSIGQDAEQQQEAVAAAIEQTDRVIGVVRRMQKYLESERKSSAKE